MVRKIRFTVKHFPIKVFFLLVIKNVLQESFTKNSTMMKFIRLRKIDFQAGASTQFTLQEGKRLHHTEFSLFSCSLNLFHPCTDNC